MKPLSNIDQLRLGKKLNNISNIIKTAGNFGIVIDKKAIAKKFAESDDPRLELSEYDFLGNFASTIDPRYKKYQQELIQSFYRDVRFRVFLLEKSQEPELEEILDTLCNEAIVVPEKTKYFAEPRLIKTELNDVNEKVIEKIEEKLNRIWPKIYRMIGFMNGGAWKKFKEHLIIGPIGFEYIYDDLTNPKNIIGIHPIDALTVKEYWKDGQRWWVQKPKFGMHGSQERVLHDSQISMIEWESTWGRISYLHRLIRSHNISRLMERTKINWFVLNSMFRTTHIIPTAGKGRAKAAQALAQAMNRYRDDIEFDDVNGTMIVNGSATVPASKEYWLPETDSGTPEIATVSNDGPDLSSMENLSYFDKKTYRASKIPFDRFDPASPETWHMDPTSQKRQEINYSNFVNRIRDNWSQILLKPLQIQLCLEMPELVNDFQILDNIVLEYNKYNVFNELADMELMQKKIEFCERLMGAFKTSDAEGNEINYFPTQFVVDKWLGLSSEEIEQLKKYRKDEKKEKMKQAKESIKDKADLEEYRKQFEPKIDIPGTDGMSGEKTMDDQGNETIDDVNLGPSMSGEEDDNTKDVNTETEETNNEIPEDSLSKENPNTGDKQVDKILSI